MSDYLEPAEAQERLRELKAEWPDVPADNIFARALRTVAHMEEEHRYRVVPFEEVDGRYEVRRYKRLNTEWRPEA